MKGKINSIMQRDRGPEENLTNRSDLKITEPEKKHSKKEKNITHTHQEIRERETVTHSARASSR